MASPGPGFVGALRRTARLALISAWTSWVVAAARRGRSSSDATRAEGLRRWAYGARRILGVELTLVGSVPPPSARGRLVVANHRTPLDIVPLAMLFGGHFLANHKTRRAPVIGRAAEFVGTVFVDREDRRSGARAIREVRSLLEARRTVVVFPEGTTYGGDEVRPFQRGAFLAVKGLDVEVVPVGLAYPPGFEFTEPSLGEHARSFLARAVNPTWVAVGDPVDASRAVADEESLRAEVQRLVERARAASLTGRTTR